MHLRGGRSWRPRPLRERLWPWQAYSVLALASIVMVVWLRLDPDAVHHSDAAVALLLVEALCMLAMGAVSHRVRR